LGKVAFAEFFALALPKTERGFHGCFASDDERAQSHGQYWPKKPRMSSVRAEMKVSPLPFGLFNTA